ncbi:MAG: hypothetical protein BZ135_01015 [Methanosphaera sp. rholeuAM6]|nr:MAG: hypothetical protein BZ135_01015 [Methanosphaera sp. rholeuAM6]
MVGRNKKLEILSIDDIRSSRNKLLSDKTNHYLQNMLFSLRLFFRYNADGIDDFVDFYYYVEDLLNNNVLMDLYELKIFIYRVTDLIVNMEDYDVRGGTLIGEVAANLLQSLYLELETYRLVDKTDESEDWKNVLLNQVKNQVVDFDVLVELYSNVSDDSLKDLILSVLVNNYPMEFAVYNARNNILEW